MLKLCGGDPGDGVCGVGGGGGGETLAGQLRTDT